MFGPDADVDPLKRPPRPASSVAELRQNPPEISYGNTRMMDDDDLEPSRTSGRSGSCDRRNTLYVVQGSLCTLEA